MAATNPWINFHVELARRLGTIPGVQAAGLTNSLPLGGSGSESGILSYVVSRRTQEFGVRLALGATRATVFGLVVRQALLLLVPGLLLGLSGGAALGRFARGMFYDVSPGDPVTFAAVSGILAAVGLLASYVPARRAVRVDPISALRTE